MARKPKTLPPLHPGEVLREEFLKPFDLSAYKAAALCGVPRTRLERIAKEETGISTDTALRLAKLFGTSTDFWLNLQMQYEVERVLNDIDIELEDIETLEGRGLAQLDKHAA